MDVGEGEPGQARGRAQGAAHHEGFGPELRQQLRGDARAACHLLAVGERALLVVDHIGPVEQDLAQQGVWQLE